MQSAVLAIIDSVRLSVCPSVCQSVAAWYHVKMTQTTVMVFTGDSPMTLISSWLTSPRNSKGNIGSEGAE